MFLAAGGRRETNDFDVLSVLPLPPVPTGGSITITGPVSTGRFQAAAGDNLTTAANTAGTSIEASAVNDIVMGVLDSGGTHR